MSQELLPMRIKICGITNAADAELAARLGADALGLNFYPKSPRFIEPAEATAVTRGLPATVTPVAVMVAPTPEEVLANCVELQISVVQLHGTPPTDALAALFVEHGLSLLVACGVKDEPDLQTIRHQLAAWRERGVAVAGVLADARVEGLHGGTGRTAPWDLLAGFDPGVPLYLAGGLTPDNVAEAIRSVRPAAVDVASGVESAPGRKDPEKLRRFIENARAA